MAFSDPGAVALKEEFDIEIDAYGYGIFLESRRRPKGQIYKLRTVRL